LSPWSFSFAALSLLLFSSLSSSSPLLLDCFYKNEEARLKNNKIKLNWPDGALIEWPNLFVRAFVGAKLAVQAADWRSGCIDLENLIV
jgi:hypothetical protein